MKITYCKKTRFSSQKKKKENQTLTDVRSFPIKKDVKNFLRFFSASPLKFLPNECILSLIPENSSIKPSGCQSCQFHSPKKTKHSIWIRNIPPASCRSVLPANCATSTTAPPSPPGTISPLSPGGATAPSPPIRNP